MQQTCQQPTLRDVPRWHTQLLVFFLLAVASTGAWLGAPTVAAESRLVDSYLPLVGVACGLSLYVSRVGLKRSVLVDLVPLRWQARDVLVATCLASVVLALEHVLTRSLGAPESLAAHRLAPVTPTESAAWLIVATCVGVSEELVYRGYLQRRLAALAGSVVWGILLQAVLFGIAHGEQGALVVARFAAYGALFGVVATWRGSILPGIAAHVVIDWCALATG